MEVNTYRRMRPQNFRDVRGQDMIVGAIKNQIIHDRVSHAYLFFGIRGTGKTTVARIFARALNCDNPIDGEPCNECEACKKALSGEAVNVIEWDGSAHGLIEDIRDMERLIARRHNLGKCLVFVIDEIQEMTYSAKNAFLKTLEDPPEDVVFIMATTEINKIPQTIVSRCQQYDFKRIELATLIDQLRAACELNGLIAEGRALKRIAILAEGSMRDALTLLDRVNEVSNNNEIT